LPTVKKALLLSYSSKMALFHCMVVAIVICIKGSSAFLQLNGHSRQALQLRHSNIINHYGAATSIKRESLRMTATAVNLSEVGNDIVILPSETGIVKIVMKFGGSSLATPERVTYVARLIKKHVEQGYKPMIVCSAMGKTTNSLISAGDFALSGQVYVEALRTMHINTINTLELSPVTVVQIDELLEELSKLLEGIKYIGELTPRTKDALVSFGERMSVRIVAATLNKMGVPAQAFDSWTLGMRTTSEFGNAEVKEETYANVKSITGI
jgi:hypothetical protein